MRKVTLKSHVTLIWRSRSIVTVWNYIYLKSLILKTCKTNKYHRSSVTRARVRKGHAQGHVTLSYKVTLDSYNVDLYLFDIRDPKNLQNKKKIIALASLEPELGKVTLRVTWPCHTRSRLIVTVWIYIYLTSATLKTCETKKDHRSSVTRTRVRKGHAQGHVTLSYKVTLDSYSVDLYLFDIRDPENLRNKKKIIVLASLEPELGKVTLSGHVTLSYKVTLDSYSVDLYLFDIRDPKNLRNKKKDHRSNVTRTRVRKGHAQGHVTLSYKVTLDSYSVDLYLFDIRDPKNLRNKKKDHRSSVTRTRVRKGHAQGHVTLTHRVTLEKLQCGFSSIWVP